MRDFKIDPINALEAVERAQKSIVHALNAFEAKRLMEEEQARLNYWSGIFINSPVILLTLLFFISVILEIIFSMPMYLDLMSELTSNSNYFYALTGALLIVLSGAAVSHFISKRMSQSIFDYSVSNQIRFRNANTLQSAVKEEIGIATIKDLVIGLIFATVLLITVIGISWQRVWLIGEITGGNYNLIHKLLPVVCVVIEIFSGIYLGYVLRRVNKVYLKNKYTHVYNSEKEKCAYQTKMAAEHYRKAGEFNEQIHFSKALKDALFRNEFRSIDNDNYVDPILTEKILKVMVNEGQSLVQGVHPAGLLSNDENSSRTDVNEFWE